MPTLQKITANLWFDTQAEEAVKYYCSIFNNSRIIKTSYFGSEGHEIHKMPEGSVMVVEYELEGIQFLALNGGPVFKLNEAVSFVINCNDQAEVDYYWNKLTVGGNEIDQQCGWLKDKFGVSWQVIPAILGDMMADKDRQKASRVMKALLQMKKIDIAALQKAYDGN